MALQTAQVPNISRASIFTRKRTIEDTVQEQEISNRACDSNRDIISCDSNSNQRTPRVSLDSNQSARSSSESSGITNISMENQVSRDGNNSPRQISSLDHSQSSGVGGLKLMDCDVFEEEEEDYLGGFPFTRPVNPVRTNGLSLWKTMR